MLRRTLKTIGQIGATLVLGLVTCLLLLSLAPLFAARNPTTVSFLGKYAPMIVLGGSMEPTYRVGSILFVERAAPQDVRVGEVITFRPPRMRPSDPPSLVTHRVTAVESASGRLSFRTQGDANNDSDQWLVPADAVVGRSSFAIPYLGYVTAFVRSRAGFVSLVIVPAALILIMELTSMARVLRERKKGLTGRPAPEPAAHEAVTP